MGAKDQKSNKPGKRKLTSRTHEKRSGLKKPRLQISNSIDPPKEPFKKPLKASTQQKQKRKGSENLKFEKPADGGGKELTKRERRQRAKELVEARKKKRKKHYTLEQELASLWERMRCRNIAKHDRSKLISEALEKMKGKIPDIASSHISSRVLQTCVKYCSQTERDSVFEELRPHFLDFACNAYAIHLVKKMLDNASKTQLAGFISLLHGHVASLLRHMVGSVVVEHAYQLGNASQKQELLSELFSTELQLFKGLVSMKENRLVDIISKLGLRKGSVLRHMSSNIQPILEKGIVDHSILHRLLMEYLSIADQTSALDVIQQLSGPLLVRMIHTRDGSRIGILCVKHGTSKERKKIIKGMKDHITKIAHDQYGCMSVEDNLTFACMEGEQVLACIVSTVDDTKLITKIIIRELKATLKELVLDKSARRLLLQLLHPNSSRYLSPDDLSSLNLSIPSLSSKDELEAKSKSTYLDNEEHSSDSKHDLDVMRDESDVAIAPGDIVHPVVGGKKDPPLRRKELLIDSGLAENLVDICIENAGELLKLNFGKEVIYEVMTGGFGAILHPALDDKLDNLYEAVASLAALPKTEEAEEEHVLENFHSSRTLRKLVLECPAFASILWKKALQGNSRMWAQGHSSKVVSAFWESSKLKEMAQDELQPLIDQGILKIPQTKESA